MFDAVVLVYLNFTITNRGGLAIVAKIIWSQWPFQSLIQNVKKGPFGFFCMKCRKGLFIRHRGLLIPVHLWIQSKGSLLFLEMALHNFFR
jgi:hypothetical protein